MKAISTPEEEYFLIEHFICYLDISIYNLAVARFSHPRYRRIWDSFAKTNRIDQAAIRAYRNAEFDKHLWVYPASDGQKTSFASLELNDETGEWHPHSFEPEWGLYSSSLMQLRKPGFHQLITPAFLGIYHPFDSYHEDAPYYRYVYRDLGLRKGDNVLVIGPGVGSDVWVTWLRTQSTVYVVAPSPLEAANCLATANIAGIPVQVVVGDNIIDHRGRPWFPGVKFRRVIWNAPAFTGLTGRRPCIGDLRELWDNQRRSDLRRFARGLSSIAVEDDFLALYWLGVVPSHPSLPDSEISGTQTYLSGEANPRLRKTALRILQAGGLNEVRYVGNSVCLIAPRKLENPLTAPTMSKNKLKSKLLNLAA